MRSFNKDGSEAQTAGNNMRCVGKYMYDKGYIRTDQMSVETACGVNRIKLYIRDGKVNSVSADMGKADFSPAAIPAVYDGDSMIGASAEIGGQRWDISCLSLGNPHCVVFCDSIDGLDLEKLGPLFENAPIFPERINTIFVRLVNSHNLRIRVWERGNGETLACGTGACAAVAAAVENGLCEAGKDITVTVTGGELTVNYTRDRVLLSGGATLVYEGSFEY